MDAPYCSYIGDSIAVELQSFDKGCDVKAKKGLGAKAILQQYGGASGTLITIISMGSNQPEAPDNIYNMLEVRRSVRSRVVWILPYNRSIAAKVTYIARGLGDLTIDLGSFPDRDGVHPTWRSEQAISKLIEYIKIEYKNMQG